MEWPIVYVLSLVTIRAFFLQGAGLLILIVWTSAMTLSLAVHLYAVSLNLESVMPTAGIQRWMVLGTLASGIWVGTLAFPTPIASYDLLFVWRDLTGHHGLESFEYWSHVRVKSVAGQEDGATIITTEWSLWFLRFTVGAASRFYVVGLSVGACRVMLRNHDPTGRVKPTFLYSSTASSSASVCCHIQSLPRPPDFG